MKRPHKYGAKPIWHCLDCNLPFEKGQTGTKNCPLCHGPGEHFDSKSEYKRWCDLKILERTGEIDDLRRQIRYPLSVNGTPVVIRSPRYKNGRQIVYVADYVYRENGETIVEDRKGVWTSDAKLKVAFFEAQYGKRVRITGAATRVTVGADLG